MLRAIAFEGFAQLRTRCAAIDATDDPRADLLRTVAVFRSFARDNAALAQVMFSRPVADLSFDADELEVVSGARESLVGAVRRGIDAGLWAGGATDIAHVLLALAQGLALQETAGWLGTSRASVNRRWTVAFDAVLDGLAP